MTRIIVYACMLTALIFDAVILHAQTLLPDLKVSVLKPENFMTGLKKTEIDSLDIQINKTNSLSTFLPYYTSAIFKSYGSGQLSTISLRGTASHHTALLWNGININFPSLGLTDFSTVPLTGFSSLSVQFGSSASIFGSDAVGGSISVGSNFDFKKLSNTLSLISELDQRGAFANNLNFKITKISKNKNFIGLNTSIYQNTLQHLNAPLFVKDQKGYQLNLEPAKSQMIGLSQDFTLLQKNGNQLSINIWLNANTATINPENIDVSEATKTDAKRFLVTYQIKSLLFKTAYINDKTAYSLGNTQKPELTTIEKIVNRVEKDIQKKYVKVKMGADLSHFIANVDNYPNTRITENRLDAYLLTRLSIHKKIKIALNQRQAFVNLKRMPFTPALGIDFEAFKTKNISLSFPSNFSYSYRVPTLNERYWIKYGNPDIKPEQGKNLETGMVLSFKQNQNLSKLQINAFRNLVDDWVYWNPAKNYKAENLQTVLAKGLEISLSNTIEAKFKTNINYAYTHTSQQKIYGAYTADIIGKQIIYIPKHTLSQNLNLYHKKWIFILQQNFNSTRYTAFDHSGSNFRPYYIGNIICAYTAKQTTVNLKINNFSNTLYPNIKNNAMPMRSYGVQIQHSFNLNKTKK
jgi:vitamin B12 transporter